MSKILITGGTGFLGNMNSTIKRTLYPFRKLAKKFVEVDSTCDEWKIIYKAANIIASENVEGDYLEFGVFTGSSFIDSYNVIKKVYTHHTQTQIGRSNENLSRTRSIWEKMRFFAFDSFLGLPELSDIDKHTKYFKQGEYSATEKQFLRNIIQAGLPKDKVITVSGWYEETCTEETIIKYGITKASIIHIDCDLFSSTKIVLDFIKPLLLDGTVIIFDDWYCFRGNPLLGEAGAFNEWKETMSGWTFVEYQKEGSCRNSFIASKN